MEWDFHFGILEHYFPKLEVGKLTLDNFWERIKLVKKFLGQDKKPVEEMSPDEWFEAVLSGEIPADAPEPITDDPEKFKQVAELRALGFM